MVEKIYHVYLNTMKTVTQKEQFAFNTKKTFEKHRKIFLVYFLSLFCLIQF